MVDTSEQIIVQTIFDLTISKMLSKQHVFIFLLLSSAGALTTSEKVVKAK